MFVDDFDALRNVFHHISFAHTVKLWFYTEEFAKRCIDLIAEELDMKCVDVYPYAKVHVLPYLHQRVPHLSALNMRPHSNQFHASGLELPSFPDFSKLTTLILDNYGLEGDLELPKTVTSLDFSKRDQTHYRALLPKLIHLSNLEYFTLSHADMSKSDDFNDFVRINLRMCKICSLNLCDNELVMNLKMIKFDLCYGNILAAINEFLSFNPKLSILSVNVLCNRDSLETVYSVCSELRTRHVGLHLSILQNYPDPKGYESPFNELRPPTSLFYVLSKFEASFVEDAILFRSLLMSGSLKVLRECKFVECDALTSEVLQHLSEITWRRDRRVGSLAACYLSLVHDHREVIKGKKARFFAKTFSENEEGEEIVVWEPDTSKTVRIRDFNDHQKYRTLGFIVGPRPVQELEDEVE
ncbi:unnamed protein product [Heligmosomoides polygyrus]|uniref:F-box domain-containing protein n=1 Tax=Heligmosomoides polygyrus TaxID=6339 RepID=A0A3P7WYV9_HELPZ|nr:unnamed protein product [Heligmosomoides polygyrus]